MYVYDHIHTYGLQVRGAGGAQQRVLVAAQIPGGGAGRAPVGSQLCAAVLGVAFSSCSCLVKHRWEMLTFVREDHVLRNVHNADMLRAGLLAAPEDALTMHEFCTSFDAEELASRTQAAAKTLKPRPGATSLRQSTRSAFARLTRKRAESRLTESTAKAEGNSPRNRMKTT